MQIAEAPREHCGRIGIRDANGVVVTRPERSGETLGEQQVVHGDQRRIFGATVPPGANLVDLKEGRITSAA